jgi:hypothetical protein
LKVINAGWFSDTNVGFRPTKGITPKHLVPAKKGQRISPATEFKKGQIPYNFKGDDVGYYALHTWLRRNFGKPTVCECCGANKNLCWASKNWNYSRVREDWWMLCKGCNSRYDKENAWGVASNMFPEIRR